MAKLRIEVDRPCTKPGVSFVERDGGRFCLSCEEMQHDLRDATLKEALALIDANGGRICGTFRTGPAGELRFRPEAPSPLGRAARGVALALAVSGCGTAGETTPSPPTAMTPPPSTSSAPPPSAPPPTTAPPTTAPDSSVLPTDASADPEDHAQHAHNHAPVPVVGIDGISGASMVRHVSGGATARPVTTPAPRVRVDRARIEERPGGGDLDRAVLARALATRMSPIRACYGRELTASPTLAGELACAMTVTEHGEVTDVSVVRDTMGSPAVAACVTRVVSGMHVLGATGGNVTLTVPFVFEPPDDDPFGL